MDASGLSVILLKIAFLPSGEISLLLCTKEITLEDMVITINDICAFYAYFNQNYMNMR